MQLTWSCIHLEVALRGDTKRIGHTIEESKHGRNIHSLGDLRLTPSMIPEILYIFVRCAIRGLCHFCHVVEERAFSRAQLGLIQSAICNRLHCLLVCSLNPQEVGV